MPPGEGDVRTRPGGGVDMRLGGRLRKSRVNTDEFGPLFMALFKSKTCIGRNTISGKGSGGKTVPVAVPVAELGPLSPVPAGDPAVVLGDPGEAVHLL